MELSSRHAIPFAAALTACTVLTDLSKLGPRDGGVVGPDVSTVCVDTKSDPNHCGACNHSCLGGTCTGGFCQPKIIDTSSATPQGLGIDSASLFWTTPTTGVVTRWALSGAGAPTVFASGQQTPTRVATVDDQVVWLQSAAKGIITACPSAASCATPKDLATGQPNPVDLFAANGTAYWTANDVVVSCVVAGAGCIFPMAVAFGVGATGAVVADATDVYFTTTKGLGRCPGASGCPGLPAILDPSPAIVALAIDATSVYWSNSASSSILKCAKPACAGGPTTVALGQAQVQGIAVDASGVYWTSAADGTVKRAPITGGATTTLIGAQSGPAAIVLDTLSVYWVNTKGGGAVLRLAKP